MQQKSVVAPDDLSKFAAATLRAVGLSEEDARTTAWALVEANLEGLDTHGVSRLALYARRVKAGLAAARPSMRWKHPAPAVAHLDAANALGPVAAVAALDEAVRLAKMQGVGMVTVAHTNHAAAFSVYTERAARQGCLALMVGNTPPAVPPWGGKTAFLGTNPLAFTVPGPAPDDPPMSYTQTARPGSRAPHVWLEPGRSTLDLFGRGFVLLRFDRKAGTHALEAAANERGLPVKILDLDHAEARALYARRLVLVRPDGFVAWRGDRLPGDVGGLVDQIRGAL